MKENKSLDQKKWSENSAVLSTWQLNSVKSTATISLTFIKYILVLKCISNKTLSFVWVCVYMYVRACVIDKIWWHYTWGRYKSYWLCHIWLINQSFRRRPRSSSYDDGEIHTFCNQKALKLIQKIIKLRHLDEKWVTTFMMTHNCYCNLSYGLKDASNFPLHNVINVAKTNFVCYLICL